MSRQSYFTGKFWENVISCDLLIKNEKNDAVKYLQWLLLLLLMICKSGTAFFRCQQYKRGCQ